MINKVCNIRCNLQYWTISIKMVPNISYDFRNGKKIKFLYILSYLLHCELPPMLTQYEAKYETAFGLLFCIFYTSNNSTYCIKPTHILNGLRYGLD